MGARPSPLAVAACFAAFGAAVLALALAVTVERTQPVIIDVPEQARLTAYDEPMYNIVVLGPDSETER